MKLLTVLRRESPLTLAREAVWRTRKRWRKAGFRRYLEVACPVQYRPVGYYGCRAGDLDAQSRQVIYRYADAVCRGEFPGFAFNPVTLGGAPQWNLDFVSGHSWPQVPAGQIPFTRNDGSDIKVPWELSRLQFLPVMGKAWRLSGDERYLHAAKDLLIHWIAKNRVGYGVNWTIAMEASLRAISICLFLEFVPPSAAGDSWWTEVTRCLWQHLIFIEVHIEFSYLARGNHYLSNVAALFCLSSFLQGAEMARRRRLYGKLIQEEMLLQVYRDGGDYEASTGYHVLNLQMFTNTFLLMQCQEMSMHQDFVNYLRRMYGFLAALADPHGRVPHIGDCDDGRVELLSDDLEQMFIANCEDRHSLTICGLLGIGEALFGENYGGHHKDASWYAIRHRNGENFAHSGIGEQSVLFADSGIVTACLDQLKVALLAMPNGIGGKGTHTHNDKLSVLASYEGKPLFIDSGTGCYTRSPQKRNRFRSTAAHNTIQVDGCEQNCFSTDSSCVFVINDDAKVTPITISHADNRLHISASHDGYARLGVMHERSVELGPRAMLTIRDHLSGAGRHTFEMRFHIPFRWKIDMLHDQGNETQCRIRDDVDVLNLTCRSSVDLRMSYAGTELSPAYGLVTKGLVILVRGSFETSLTITSRINSLG